MSIWTELESLVGLWNRTSVYLKERGYSISVKLIGTTLSV